MCDARSAPPAPGGGTPGSLLRPVAVVAAALALVGCAPGGDDRVTARTGATPPAAAGAADRAGSPDASGAGGSGSPSLGVDSVAWPRDLDGAGRLLASLPPVLAGQERELYLPPPEEDVDLVGASYGDSASLTVAGELTVEGASSPALPAMFGLMYGCAEGSYAGTAPGPAEPGGGPDIAAASPPGPVWFSCTVDGAEGDEDFAGHALGWTSGATSWLVVARDPEGLRALVAAAQEASR